MMSKKWHIRLFATVGITLFTLSVAAEEMKVDFDVGTERVYTIRSVASVTIDMHLMGEALKRAISASPTLPQASPSLGKNSLNTQRADHEISGTLHRPRNP